MPRKLTTARRQKRCARHSVRLTWEQHLWLIQQADSGGFRSVGALIEALISHAMRFGIGENPVDD
jgi:hypothetical protein